MSAGAYSGGARSQEIGPRALIREYFWRHRWRYAAGFVLLGSTNLLALTIPRLMKHAVDSLQASDRRALITSSLAIVVVAVVQAVVRTFSRFTILGASRRVANQLRGRLFSHLQRLPLTFYGLRPIGDITSRAINDMLLVRTFFGFGLMNLINTILVYITVLSMMFIMDVRLTLYALLPYPFFILAVNRLGKRVYARTMKVQHQMSDLTAKAQENISGMSLIKTFAREEAEAETWSAMSHDYLTKTLALARARGALMPLMGIMASAGTLVVVGLGGRAVIEGRLTLGDFVAYNAYLAYLVWPTLAFGWILNVFQRGAVALRRVAEILSEPAEDRTMPPEWENRPLAGDIDFRGLRFRHEGAPSGTEQLKGIDLRVPAGTTLGILGTVGSGKSTLVNMLPRVLPPPPGSVFIDGHDLADIPLARLRRDIGMVPQESFLFSRSLRENIALSARPHEPEDINDAIEASQFSRDMPQFPEGLDTVVGERGVTLSGGQRQRATIARALAARPRILVLDDSLSSLDAEVERDLVDQLRRSRSTDQRTLIIVSNRVATLSWADQIVVMDEGEIVERGTHTELVASGGLYSRIAGRQSLADRLEEL